MKLLTRSTYNTGIIDINYRIVQTDIIVARKKLIKYKKSKSSIIVLGFLVLALAVGVISVNTMNFNSQSKAGVLDPEGLEGNKFDQWAKDYKVEDKYEEKILKEGGFKIVGGRAYKEGSGGKPLFSLDESTTQPTVPWTGPTHYENGTECTGDKPSGVCEPADCANSATSWKDCFESEWRSDSEFGGKNQNGEYVTYQFKAGDPILYATDYDHDTGEIAGQFRFTYPGATRIGVTRSENGTLAGMNIKTSGGNVTFNLDEVVKVLSDFNNTRSNPDSQYPIPGSIIDFMNLWAFDQELNGGKGGYKICPNSGSGACLPMAQLDITCESCDFGLIARSKENFERLAGSIEKVDHASGGSIVSGSFPITGCKSCQERYKGSTGNLVYDFLGSATYAVQSSLSRWLSSGVSENNPVYIILKSWVKD